MSPESIIQSIVIVFAGGLLAVCVVIIIQEVADVRRRRRENTQPVLRADTRGFAAGIDKANKTLLRTRRAMARSNADRVAEEDRGRGRAAQRGGGR